MRLIRESLTSKIFRKLFVDKYTSREPFEFETIQESCRIS